MTEKMQNPLRFIPVSKKLHKVSERNHLLVVPRIVNRIGDWYQFPMGVAYVSSSAKKAGFNVHTLNLNHVEGSISDIIGKVIKEKKIGTVSTGGVTGQYGAIREIFDAAKEHKKNILCICGGGIISSAPETAMAALEICDYGVIGEAELTFPALLQCLEKGEDPWSIPGLVIQHNGKFSQTVGEPEPVPLEEIPYPDYESFNFRELLNSVPNTIGMSEYNTLPIVTGRSCPFRCTFCFHPSGQTFRQRSLDDVFREIDYMVAEFGVKYLSIQDELFLFGKKTTRLKEFCDRIKPYGIKWLAQFRTCDITQEIVDLLKESNCATMAFGIESADDRILKSMKKGIRVHHHDRALKMVYESGIGIQGVLIFGDPAETRESAQRTFDWWKANRQYELQLSAIITYPGSPLYNNAVRDGLIPEPVKFIKDGCPLIKLTKMSDEDYGWMFGQILSLPRMMHSTPGGQIAYTLDLANSSINLTGECVACQASNTWEKNRLFVTETLACARCGRKHVSPIPNEIVDIIKDSISALNSRCGKIAIWGINAYIYALLEKLELDPADVVIVDKSEARVGLPVGSHKIESPSVIDRERIQCIVVSVVQYYAGLRQPILDEHPEVQCLMSISDLLSMAEAWRTDLNLLGRQEGNRSLPMAVKQRRTVQGKSA